MTVEILLATYNGEKYIKEQLDSILKQTFTGWHLTAQDDCSEDNTFNILLEYKSKYPDKINVYKTDANSGNAKFNFFGMLKKTNADYIMFCDQDDYWLDTKIESTLARMQESENGDLPILVHSDLTIADEGLNILKKSMFLSQALDYKKILPNNMVVQNIITGCTVMINRPLADLLYYTPQSVPVHDWWIGLAASVFGKIVFMDTPTLLYRQHGGNQCGAQNMYDLRYIKNRASDHKKAAYMLRLGYDMALEFVNVYGKRLDAKTLKMLTQYGNMPKYCKLKKLIIVTRYKIWKKGLIRKIGQIIYM